MFWPGDLNDEAADATDDLDETGRTEVLTLPSSSDVRVVPSSMGSHPLAVLDRGMGGAWPRASAYAHPSILSISRPQDTNMSTDSSHRTCGRTREEKTSSLSSVTTSVGTCRWSAITVMISAHIVEASAAK